MNQKEFRFIVKPSAFGSGITVVLEKLGDYNSYWYQDLEIIYPWPFNWGIERQLIKAKAHLLAEYKRKTEAPKRIYPSYEELLNKD